MYVESPLDHWEKANLLLVAGDLFNRCLHSVYKYFIDICFHPCSSGILVCGFVLSVVSSHGLGIRLTQVLSWEAAPIKREWRDGSRDSNWEGGRKCTTGEGAR